MGDRKEGLGAALDATGPGALPELGEVMGDLFGAPIAAPRHRAADLDGEKRGPGRPKGKKNRRSQEWIDYLSSRYSMPLERMVALAAMTPIELFKELRSQAVEILGEVNAGFIGRAGADRMTEKEAMGLLIRLMEIQNAAAKEAAPYLHEKRGAVVQDNEGNDVPVLAFLAPTGERLAGSDSVQAFGMDIRPRNLRGKENQALIEGETEKSTPEKSTDNAKPLNNNDKEGG